jgi:predicted GNAT family N-acyltransferase
LPLTPGSEFRIELFDKHKHDRAAFSCEHEALVTYLRQQASQDVAKHVAAVFVLTPDGKTVAGYYTLSQYAVEPNQIPPELLKELRLPRYPRLPATLLGRLARSLEFRNQGVGRLLLLNALHQSLSMSRTIASTAVVVDAKDDQAVMFYQAYGFLPVMDSRNRLFLPMKTIEQAFQHPPNASPPSHPAPDSTPEH